MTFSLRQCPVARPCRAQGRIAGIGRRSFEDDADRRSDLRRTGRCGRFDVWRRLGTFALQSHPISCGHARVSPRACEICDQMDAVRGDFSDDGLGVQSRHLVDRIEDGSIRL